MENKTMIFFLVSVSIILINACGLIPKEKMNEHPNVISFWQVSSYKTPTLRRSFSSNIDSAYFMTFFWHVHSYSYCLVSGKYEKDLIIEGNGGIKKDKTAFFYTNCKSTGVFYIHWNNDSIGDEFFSLLEHQEYNTEYRDSIVTLKNGEGYEMVLKQHSSPYMIPRSRELLIQRQYKQKLRYDKRNMRKERKASTIAN